ncbi:MAG: Cof-type HAD-IIB family hydrolase [Dehalococcoidia bacterium]|nr:Cof-type HAD-IIB family hydrolase [Dehalococcoidia bacterium]
MANTSIRFIALDCDGTLLDPKGQVRPRVRDAVQKALAMGCLVTLATGRRFPFAKAAADALGIRTPLVLHGGAVIQDSETGAVVYQDLIPAPVYRRIIDCVFRHGLQPVVFESPAAGGRILTGPEERDTPVISKYLAMRRSYHRFSFDELVKRENILSVSLMGDEAPLRRFHEEVSGWGESNPMFNAPSVHVGTAVTWHTVDILPFGCCKARAIGYLAGTIGISLAEAMAVGDNLNDLDMLEAVGWSVAMGNAAPAVKAIASAVVASNAEDGVAEAIERFVLGNSNGGSPANT